MTVTAKTANEQLALDFFAALSTGDLDNLRPFLDADSVWEPMVKDIPGAGRYQGNAIIDEFLAPVRGMFAQGDPKVHPQNIFSDGDHVCVESYSDGKLQDGRIYNNRYCWTFRMNNGKIGLLREYMDSHYVATLFGM
ncbi:MAG: nuclear transport factor 2 family protein [Sphingobium sp.]|nr:nuclear transport factor 2 family protein [Sphingobium sp.]